MLFLRLAEASDDFVIIADPDRSIDFVNPALLRAMEVETTEAFNAQGRLAFFAPEDRKTFEERVVPALERDGRWSGPMQFRSFKTQTFFPVAYQAFALHDDSGRLVGFASVSRDVGDRRRLDAGMRALAETGAAMYDSLDVESTLRNVARTVALTFASYCVVDVLSSDTSLRSIAGSNRGPEHARLVEIAARARADERNHPAWRTVLRGESTLMPVVLPEWLVRHGTANVLGDDAPNVDPRSILFVPIHSRQDGGIYGSLTCALDEHDPRKRYTVDDLRFAEEIAIRAGLALDHARAYERERRIAVTLQEASLPQTLPIVDGLIFTADYRPGSGEATIGGDWYDAFVLDDGRVAITIGDVQGHGLQAAVTMGKVRQAMQAVATVRADPNAMLDIADRVVRAESDDAYATAVAGIFDPRGDELTYASAGHPGPLLRFPNGEVDDLTGTSTSTLLGMRAKNETTQRTIRVPPGSRLMFFTDGLSEVARDVMGGTQRIRDAIADPAIAFAESPASALVDRILGNASASDDIAVLVAAIGPHERREQTMRLTHDRRATPDIAVSLAAEALARSGAKVLIVPARLADIAAVRRAMRSLIAVATDARDVADTVELATGELMANAVKYGSGATVDVSLCSVSGGAVVAVTNIGRHFEDGNRDLAEMVLAEQGRGLAILRALGCTVEVVTQDDRCTVSAFVPFGSHDAVSP